MEDRINKLETALAKSQEEIKDLTKGKDEPEFFRNCKKEKLKAKKVRACKLKAEIAYQKQLLKQQEKEK